MDMSLRPRNLFIGLALLAAQAAASAAHAQTVYQLTPLGTLGGDTAVVYAINNVGDIVGCSQALINGAPTSRAYVYRNGLMMDIGSLATAGTSCAYDVNDAGVITGTSAAPTGESRGFVYRNGAMTSLGNFGTSSNAVAINNNGLIAGTANDFNGSIIGAFRADSRVTPPQIVDLGSLGGPVMASKGINAAGDVVGFASNAQFSGTTFLYQNGVLTDLGNVLGFPNAATAINDVGQVVGTRTEGGYVYANGVATTLPSLEGNGSSPNSINNKGQIVGSSWTEGGSHAFVITQGQIVDLNDAIVSTSPDKPFVTLVNAKDINDNGWIVAEGADSRNGGRQAAYLLRPMVTR